MRMRPGLVLVAALATSLIQARPGGDWCNPRELKLTKEQDVLYSVGRRTAWHAIDVGRMPSTVKRAHQLAYRAVHSRIPRPPRPDPAANLTVAQCANFLADRSHPFRSFWGVKFHRMFPICMPLDEARTRAWIDEMESGAVCGRNWFQGSHGCKDQKSLPAYVNPSPALIGINANIATRCDNRRGVRQLPRHSPHMGDRKRQCIVNDWNVLALYDTRPAYDMCRNLEWLVCAAKGILPGQRGTGIVSDPPPGSLPIGKLFETKSNGVEPTGYTPSTPYYLEVCALSAFCENRADLFLISSTAQFRCRWAPGALRRFVKQMAGDYLGAGQGLIAGGLRNVSGGAGVALGRPRPPAWPLALAHLPRTR
jgi:hypothetical protein